MQVAGGAPHRRLEHPAAVQGQPGDQVEGADQQVAAASPSTATSSSPSGVTNQSPSAAPPTASDVRGPTTAIQNSWRGFLASESIAVMPPRKCRVIEVTG